SPLPESGSLKEALQAWTLQLDADLLITLDQFEEYFLYHGKEDGDGTFAVEFPRALNDADLRVNFLISIRDDAVAKLDCFKGRIPKLFSNYLRVEHLRRDAAISAIRGPLEEYNRRVQPRGEETRGGGGLGNRRSRTGENGPGGIGRRRAGPGDTIRSSAGRETHRDPLSATGPDATLG